MKSWLKLKVLVVSLLCVVLISPAGASASGSAGISGQGDYNAIHWYYSSRYVSYPPSPGPEVAFNQSSGMSSLFLGTHDCAQGGAGPIYQQYIGSWQPVHYYSSPTTFCLWSYGSYNSGSFSGTLAWD